MAHSGVLLKPREVLAHKYTLRSNLDLVLGAKILAQQYTNFLVTRDAVKIATDTKLQLSACGYGFGASLAEQSVCLCERELAYPSIKAVCFESPGVFQKPDLCPSSRKTQTYLTKPNILNSSCRKINAKSFKLDFKSLSNDSNDSLMIDFVKYIEKNLSKDFKANVEFIVDNLKGFFGLGLDQIVVDFLDNDFYAGESRLKLQEVIKWPLIKIDRSKNESDRKFKLKLKKELNFRVSKFGLCIKPELGEFACTLSPESCAHSELRLSRVDECVNNFAFLDLVSFVSHLLQGRMNICEFKRELNESETDCVKYNYVMRPVESPFKSILSEEGDPDWYLINLQLIDLKSFESLSPILQLQLGEIKQMYLIESEQSDFCTKKRLVSKNEAFKAEDFGHLIKRLVLVEPELGKILSDEKNLQVSSENSVQVRTTICDKKPELFLKRKFYLTEIEKLFGESNKVVLHGPSGVGKSVLAVDYVDGLNQSGFLVRWINADCEDKILDEYRRVLAEAGHEINKFNCQKTEIIRKFNGLMNELSARYKIILVYDNIDLEYHGTEIELGDYAIGSISRRIQILFTSTNKQVLSGCMSTADFRTLEVQAFMYAEFEDYFGKHSIRIKNEECGVDAAARELLNSKLDSSPFHLIKMVFAVKCRLGKEALMLSDLLENDHGLCFEIFTDLIRFFEDENKQAFVDLLFCVASLDPDLIRVDFLQEVLKGEFFFFSIKLSIVRKKNSFIRISFF